MQEKRILRWVLESQLFVFEIGFQNRNKFSLTDLTLYRPKKISVYPKHMMWVFETFYKHQAFDWWQNHGPTTRRSDSVISNAKFSWKMKKKVGLSLVSNWHLYMKHQIDSCLARVLKIFEVKDFWTRKEEWSWIGKTQRTKWASGVPNNFKN